MKAGTIRQCSYRSLFWLCVCLGPLLVSCSAIQITYSTADWLLLWKLDDYFDLSSAQKEYLAPQIKQLHRWHRRDQLPQYAQFLDQMDGFCKDGLSETELETIFSSVEAFRMHLAKQVASPGATFLATVTSAQRRHLEEVFSKDRQRLLAKLGQKGAVRVKRRTAQTLETLTAWLGELSVDQESRIRQWIAEFPDGTEAWLAHRYRRETMLLELLSVSTDPLMLEPALYSWLADPRTGATPEYLDSAKEWRQGMAKVILEIDRILTPDQRAYLSRKLQEVIHDIRELVG